MANFRAPGVSIKEVDISEVVAPAGTSVGALVGPAYKGPTNQRILITSNQDFINTFGSPTSGTSAEFHYYAALEFLKESGFLYFVRSTTSADEVGYVSVSTTSSTELTSGSTSENKTSYTSANKPTDYEPIEALTDVLDIGALGASLENENIALTIFTENLATTTSGYSNGYNFTGKFPDTYELYKINVFTKTTNGSFPTSAEALSATPAETYIVSNSQLAKDFDGNSMYIKDVINGRSKLIYANTNNSNLSATFNGSVPVALGVGVTDFTSTQDASIIEGWDFFLNREESQPNILLGSYDPSKTAVVTAVADIASTRKDCLAVVGIGDKTDTITQIQAKKVAALSNSYTAIYTGWDLIFDSYSAKNLYVPKSVFAPAIIARTDAVANTWDAPAGLSRGGLSSLDQYKIFSEGDIGFLYNYGINTSKRVRGAGDFIWGQKTGLPQTTALDRINVRRLLLYIENTVEPALQAYLFEPNNDKTRTRVKANIDSFLQTIFAGGGLTKYETVVDESNNTPQVIDNNELAVDIFIQPTKTIEFINVKVIITRTGVSFDEV